MLRKEINAYFTIINSLTKNNCTESFKHSRKRGNPFCWFFIFIVSVQHVLIMCEGKGGDLIRKTIISDLFFDNWSRSVSHCDYLLQNAQRWTQITSPDSICRWCQVFYQLKRFVNCLLDFEFILCFICDDTIQLFKCMTRYLNWKIIPVN